LARFQLKFRNGPQRGQRFSLTWGDQSLVLMGRSRSATVRLPTPDISRRHCQLIREEDRVSILDLGSRAGTYVNREEISTESATPLNHRDKIQIGKWKFRFLDAKLHAASDRDGIDASSIAPAVPKDTVPKDAVPSDSVPKETVKNDPVVERSAGVNDSTRNLSGEDTLDMMLGELDKIAEQIDGGEFESFNTISIDALNQVLPSSRESGSQSESQHEEQSNASEKAVLEESALALDASDAAPGQSPSPESLDLIAEAFKKESDSPSSEVADHPNNRSVSDRSGNASTSGGKDANQRPGNPDAESGESTEEQRFKKIPEHLRRKKTVDSKSAADEALKRIFGG
jgi:predicted component of type VI protein secretion system